MAIITKTAPAAARKNTGRRPGAAPHAEEKWALPGLCWNARVTTTFGEMPVQGLRVRDMLRCADGTTAMVEWVDEVHLDESFLYYYPDAQPIRIPAGSFGPGRPATDMVVSPQQRINIGMGPLRPEFRLARDLTDRPGIMRQPETSMTYYLFHCGRPVTVMAEGCCIQVMP